MPGSMLILLVLCAPHPPLILCLNTTASSNSAQAGVELSAYSMGIFSSFSAWIRYLYQPETTLCVSVDILGYMLEDGRERARSQVGNGQANKRLDKSKLYGPLPHPHISTRLERSRVWHWTLAWAWGSSQEKLLHEGEAGTLGESQPPPWILEGFFCHLLLFHWPSPCWRLRTRKPRKCRNCGSLDTGQSRAEHEINKRQMCGWLSPFTGLRASCTSCPCSSHLVVFWLSLKLL